MTRVYKYELRVGFGPQRVILPVGAVPLSVAFQGDALVLWARVRASLLRGEPPAIAPIDLHVVATGDDVPEDVARGYAFLGTAQRSFGTGYLVAHVFVRETAVQA